MLEVNAIYIVFLLEGFGVSILLILLMAGLHIYSRSRNRKAVKQLIFQIKQQSKIRSEKTGYFLRQIYDLEDADLKAAVRTIDRQENKFFQKLINMFLYRDTEMLTTMDADLAELIDAYKNLKPNVSEVQEKEKLDKTLKQVESLKLINENLEQDLAVSKAKVRELIGEPDNIFGDTGDHEVVEQVIAKR